MRFSHRNCLLLLWVIAFTILGLSGSSAQGRFKSKKGPELNPNDEYIILSGGPALRVWEDLRRTEHQHDQYWGNFIRSARLRMQQLQKVSGNNVKITWLVYKRGYVGRQKEDGDPLISWIESVRDKYKVKLVWIDTKQDIINYVNSGENRRTVKVSGFEYFGHSNKFCFLIDYSCNNLGASRCFLHEADLTQFHKSAFARGAYCKSWGCHSAESFCPLFKRATGVKMIGAKGKTDYSKIGNKILPFCSPGGSWQ